MPGHGREIGHAGRTWRADRGHRAGRSGARGIEPFARICPNNHKPQRRPQREGYQLSLQRQRTKGHRRLRSRCCTRRMCRDCRTLRCRKTTLLKIFAGLLRPTAGAVLIDDIAIQAIGIETYRAQIGCVLQEDRLFAGSVAENVAGFSPSPDPERIQQVARFAAIHEEIMRMPMGYETLVGAMGSSLSGGQMQRVVLARALYRDPRILLLDEATSHLDEDNEQAINEAIRRLTISRVIVAHRRSTLDMADRIVPIWPSPTSAKRAG